MSINLENKINKTYVKKVSTLSKTTMTTNENNETVTPKMKKHISFKENFLVVIDVESWKNFNFDVSEIDPEWKKVESSNKSLKNIDEKINNNNKNCNHNNNNKDKKVSCECAIF